MKRRILSICTALCLCLTLLPAAALAAETEGGVLHDVPYIDEKGEPQICKEATVVTSDTTKWSTGWYVVDRGVLFNERITVEGNVHLILNNGLYVREGINVSASNSLTIWQGERGGLLQSDSPSGGAAGIGGGPGEDCRAVTVCGGEVSVFRIGGGDDRGTGGGAGGNITVTGGVVRVSGGIGAGSGATDPGTFTIKGDAVVYATGGIGNRTNEGSWRGVVFLPEGGKIVGRVYGDNVTLPPAGLEIPSYVLTIPEEASLTVPEGTNLTLGQKDSPGGGSASKLDIEGTLINRGSIWNKGEITNNGAIENYGAIENDLPGQEEYPGEIINNGAIKNYGTLPSKGQWTGSGNVRHAAGVAVEADPNPYILEERKRKRNPSP